MRLENSSGQQVWMLTQQECADYAYICTCLPTDKMNRRECDLVRKLEIKWRSSAGYVTPGQWDWFAGIAERYSAYILDQDQAPDAIRSLARVN